MANSVLNNSSIISKESLFIPNYLSSKFYCAMHFIKVKKRQMLTAQIQLSVLETDVIFILKQLITRVLKEWMCDSHRYSVHSALLLLIKMSKSISSWYVPCDKAETKRCLETGLKSDLKDWI